MTVSIRRISLGCGFAYLMSSVARGDVAHSTGSPLTRYYVESGTPEGRWIGSGLAGLAGGVGVAPGSVVSEEGLWRLLGLLADPATGAPLGQRPTAIAGVDGRRPVAGFDLTFSVPKSISVVWALAPPAVQAEIYRAHQDAILATLAWMEANVIWTRTGHGGTVQTPTRGLVAAAFDHWDSRAGDPHLHTHLVVANRVQTEDGRWRTLDSKTLFRYTVALSELHQGVLQDLLTERLGFTWTPHTRPHSNAIRWDATGVPERLVEAFSSRSRMIGAEKDRLVAEFADTHGRQPSAVEVLKLRQRATLATRPDKQHSTLGALMRTWRDRALLAYPAPADGWLPRVLNRPPEPPFSADDPDALDLIATTALDAVARKRAVFGEANVVAQVHRQLHGTRFANEIDRLTAADAITCRALGLAVSLDPAGLDLSRSPIATSARGRSTMHRGAARFTTRMILDAERRLLDAATTLTAPTAPPTLGHDLGLQLGTDQRAAVESIVLSGRVLDLLVGPAGTGKTTTLSHLKHTWEEAHGPRAVIGMAPSAAAAQALSDELGIATENTAKWLYEHHSPDRPKRLDHLRRQLRRHQNPDGRLTQRQRAEISRIDAEQQRWNIHPGQLVIIDEASLADTVTLDDLTGQAVAAGAKVLLVGDPAQLGSVNAGGAFALLAERHPSAELTTVRRFDHAWEADASRRLSIGNSTAIDAYLQHDRIRAGDREQVLDHLVSAWLADRRTGLNSVMIATDDDSVRALNQLAQAHWVDADELQVSNARGAGGIPLCIGDRIVTRRNDRRLRVPGGWVKNGDTWTIAAAHGDGSLAVRAETHAAPVVLPADYVREHVELGYAITAYRSQGHTYDTAHALIDERCTREALYVAATRARGRNKIYLDTSDRTDPDTAHEPGIASTIQERLNEILDRPAAAESAHSPLPTRHPDQYIVATQDRRRTITQPSHLELSEPEL